MRNIALALLLAANIVPGPTTPANNSIGTAKLVDGAVTTAKIADANVTDAKLTGQVSPAHGGTGADLSASTGVLKDAAGTISATTIVNADVSTSAAIARSKLATGTANALVVDDGTGVFSTLACTSGEFVIGNATPAPACVAMSGDATLSSGGALTLASSGVTAASYGDASHVAAVTFDAKGRATAASSTSIAIAESQVTSLTGDLSAKAPLAGATFTGAVAIEPTTDVNGLVVRQTSALTPVSDVFDVTDSTAGTAFFRVDKNGEAIFNDTVTATAFDGNATSATTATTATNFSGSLSGDVTGGQSTTSVVKLQGRDMDSTAPGGGNSLVWNSGTSKWTATAAGGDVTGSYSALTVGKLQGRAVDSGAPSDGEALVWSAGSSTWTHGSPTTATNFSGSLAGDVTGTQGATVVSSLRGNPVSSSAPSAGQALVWNGSGSTWEPGMPTLGPLLYESDAPITVTGSSPSSTTALVPVDCTAGSVNVVLPTMSGSGRVLVAVRLDSTANACTVTPGGVGTINGATGAYSLASQYSTVSLVSSGGDHWFKIGST